MNTLPVTKALRQFVRRAYPEYRGRRFSLQVADRTFDVRSCWDGGSRDYYIFIDGRTGRRMPIPAQSAFDRQIPGADKVSLPPDCLLLRHTYFCGKDLGITVFVHPDNVPKWLPEGEQ